MTDKHKNKQIITIFNSLKNQNTIKLINNNLFYTANNQNIKIQLNNILFIIIIGNFTISTPFIKKLANLNIGLYLCDYNLRLLSKITNNIDFENHTLIKQIQINSSKQKSLIFAQNIAIDKLTNQLKLLYNKKHISKKECKQLLIETSSSISNCKNVNQILGVEGSFAKYYFNLLFKKYKWKNRKPRKKEDITNYLLDIGYSYLYNFTNTLIENNELIPRFGFLHINSYLRNSLTCDLVEPFRYLIDNQITKLYNLKQIKEEWFIKKESKINIKEYKNLEPIINGFAKTLIQNQETIYEYIINIKQKIKTYDANNL